MHVRPLSEEAFLAAGERWDRFLAGSSADSFFLRHDWLSLWWKNFSAGKTSLVLEVVDGAEGKTIGFAPFCITKETAHGVLPLREVSFMGREKVTGDYLDFIAEPGRETEVVSLCLKWLMDHADRWDTLRISDMLESSPTHRILAGAAPSLELELAPMPGQVCPYRPLPATWDLFMAECSANLRSNLRRREKKLLAMGAKFVEVKGDAIPAALDAMFELHGARWETRGKTGNFVDPRVRAFHHALAPKLERDGKLGLWTIEHEGKTVAAIYGFRHRTSFLYYQAGFDPAYADHGVGLALMGHAIKQSIAAGMSEFDYLRGEEDYKRRWTDLSRQTLTTMVLRPSLRGWAWKTLGATKEVAKKLLKRDVPAPKAPEPEQPAVA